MPDSTSCTIRDLHRFIFMSPCARARQSSADTAPGQSSLAFPTHSDNCLYAESHDRVDDVVVVLLQGLDGLLAGDGSLLHDELDVLGLEAGVVDLLAVVLLLDLLLGLALLVSVVVVVVVVVAGVVVTLLLGLGELLGGRSLGLRVQVLDLGLTEDAGAGSAGCLPSLCAPLRCGRNSHVGVAGGGLVDIGLVDDEEDLGAC